MRTSPVRLACAAAMFLPGIAFADLTNYWPVTEASGTTTANSAGGQDGTLFNGVSFITDAQRGQVLNLPGAGAYVNAGSIPVLDLNSNFTWSFWANTSLGASSTVIVGNRYSPVANTDFDPREFIKFTNNAFEWHRQTVGENIDYPVVPTGIWNHFSVVKQGNLLISYRNGIVDGTRHITAGLNNPQPFYFGGDQNSESWTGRLDDVATWTNPMPSTSVLGLAKGTFTPATAPLTVTGPALATVMSDNFSGGLGNWTISARGLENNAPAGYNPPTVNGSGQVEFSGTTTSQFWYGSSIESVALFDATKITEVSVDRITLSGVGTAYRSSLWILGDNQHYLHFAQNIGENGWQWNARDDGGMDNTGLMTGSGFDITGLNSLDADGGLHSMKIRLEPTGDPGDVNMFMYLDGSLVAARGFTNFPDQFRVVLTGQARATNDSVSAAFDNVVVQQVPEPGSAVLLLSALGLASARRRRSA